MIRQQSTRRPDVQTLDSPNLHRPIESKTHSNQHIRTSRAHLVPTQPLQADWPFYEHSQLVVFFGGLSVLEIWELELTLNGGGEHVVTNRHN